jgi:hypothetical protein
MGADGSSGVLGLFCLLDENGISGLFHLDKLFLVGLQTALQFELKSFS